MKYWVSAVLQYHGLQEHFPNMLPLHMSVNNFGILAVVAIFGLIITLLFLFDFSRKSAKGSSIPGPDASDPETGNLADLGKAGSLHEYVMKLHQDYGPIAAFWWGKTYVVSLASPEYWKEVNHVFDRPAELFKLFEPLIGKKSIQYGNGPMGRRRRQMMDRSFSHDAVQDYYIHFVQIVKETAKKLEDLPAEEHIPVGDTMITMAIKSIAIAGMGRQFLEEKQVSKLSSAYETCWVEMERQLTEPAPEPGSDAEKCFEEAKKQFWDLVRDLVRSRRETEEKDERLFIDSLLECDFIDEETICCDIISFLVGGFHTTANMMTWCIYYLAMHPDIQEKVHEEIVDVLGDMDITAQVSSQLKYTRQVIDETLRCAVIAPWGARYHEYDLQIEDYVIPAGTPMLLPFGVVLQDPNIWPEPKRFDPDRFSPEEVKQRPSMAYQPFGFAGKRKCPGWRFSIVEGLVFLSVLCRAFKFHLVKGQKVEPVHHLVTSPKDEIWVTVTKR